MPQFIVSEDCPLPLERALRAAVFEYSKQRKEFLHRFAGHYDEEFSVTDLYQAPKQLWLKRKWSDDIVIDLVKDNYFSLLGNIVHFIMEHYAPPHAIVEERQHTVLTIDGVRVLFHGKPDYYDTELEELDDYKYVSPYAILYDRSEYEFQLNAGAWLYENRGIPVKSLRNVYMFSHLDPVAATRNPDYPKDNIHIRKFVPWPRDVTERKIRELIAKQLRYRNTHWKQLPDCTDAERWLRDSSWAVIKRNKTGARKGEWGNKAFARFDTQPEAETFITNSLETEEMKIEKRIGEPKKCVKYCPVVAWCAQRQNELKTMEKKVLIDQ